MQAVFVTAFDPENPAGAIRVDERPTPRVPDGWSLVHVRAASLNHHDVWAARGIGLTTDRLPMILGTDAAGVTDEGREVVVHGLITSPDWLGSEVLDPDLSLLSERHQGTFAEQVVVPTTNLLPKPETLSFEEAACLPTAWLTAYRMLFSQSELSPGDTVLVQGSSGGLSSALIALADAAGMRVWVTGRSDEKRQYAETLGADATFAPGERLPSRVDAVMDSVGAATWTHSLKALRRGGTMVVAGGTGGYLAEVEVARVFAMGLRIIGSAVGTRDEFRRLLALLGRSGLRPHIAEVFPLDAASKAFARMATGDLRGKLVLQPG